MAKFKTAIISILVILVIIIVLQNTQSVETKFLFMSVTMPRAVLLVVTFLLGFAVGIIAAKTLATKVFGSPQ
jgi:uncharacterized integral membrane protein